MPTIKAIVHVFSSNRDVNGNCYHAVRVTNTETGLSVECQTDGPENPRYHIREENRDLGWDSLYQVHEWLPIREWNRGPGKFPHVRDERAAYAALLGL